MKLQSSLRRATASMMNTQNGISFLQMQDSVLKIAGEIIDRMSELKSFYNDVSKNDTDRETYNHEFHELQKELGSLKDRSLMVYHYLLPYNKIQTTLKFEHQTTVWRNPSRYRGLVCLKILNPSMELTVN